MRAFSQVFNAAMDWGYIGSNPVARSGPNPQPKRTELVVFASDAEVDRLASEFLPTEVSGALIVFLAETGLRPEEALGLDRRHIDREACTGAVEQVFVGGTLKPVPKTNRSRRVVPLTSRALAALEHLPTRIDTPAQFPGPESPRLDLHNWRARDWETALESAGFYTCPRDPEHETKRAKAGTRRVSRCNTCGHERPVFTPYTLRHYFATKALRAGVSIFELARFMGTSVEMIGDTYGHLAPDSLDRVREKLEAVGGSS